jgi:hypothetical protein
MVESILIRYKAEGIPELSAAFDTIEKRITRLTASAQSGSQQRERIARGEADNVINLKTAEQRAADRAEDGATRTAERESRRRAIIRDNSAKYAGRLAEQQAKEEQRTETEATRDLEREMRRREQIRERSAALAGRFAEQQANAEIAAHRRIGTTVGGAVTSGTGRVLGGIASYGAMAVGAAGAFSVADAVRGRMAAERSAAQIVNAVTVGGNSQGASVQGLIDRAQGVAVTSGMSKDEILQGTLAYTRSARGGDYKGAVSNMGFFAKLAKTTGTDIGEIGKAAGTLQSQNPNLDAAAMQQMLLNAYAQSKAGSVSLSQAVTQIGTLGSTRGLYAGDEATNQRKLLALGQIAASGGMSGDIGTYVKDVSIEAAKHRKSTKGEVGLEAMGVKFDAYGRMESPEDMLANVFKGTGGDLGKLEKIFGARGLPLITELQGGYVKASQAAGGGKAGAEAGAAAVRAQIAGVAGSTMTSGDLDKQFATVMSTSGERFAVAVENIRGKIEEKLVPYIDKLAAKLGDPAFMANVGQVIDGLGALAAFLISNPVAGLGGLILASVAKDLASAAIGEGVKNTITRLISGLSAQFPGLAPGGGAGGKLVGAGVAAAVAAEATGAVFFEKSGEEAEAKAGVLGLLGKPTSEKDRVAKLAAVRAAIAEGKSQDLNSAGNIAADVALPTAKLLNQVAGVVGVNDATGAEEASARRERIKLEQRYNQELEDQLKRLTSARRQLGDPSHPARNEPISGSSPR